MSRFLQICSLLTLILIAHQRMPTAAGADLALVKKNADPYGVPRPAPNEKNVPLRTSIYVELTTTDKNAGDPILPESIAIDLTPDGGPFISVLGSSRKFATGYRGRFLPGKGIKGRTRWAFTWRVNILCGRPRPMPCGCRRVAGMGRFCLPSWGNGFSPPRRPTGRGKCIWPRYRTLLRSLGTAASSPVIAIPASARAPDCVSRLSI